MNKLLKMLTILDEKVYIAGDGIVSLFQSGGAELLTLKVIREDWFPYISNKEDKLQGFKDHLMLPYNHEKFRRSISPWSTFRDCTDSQISVEEGDIIVTMSIYDGDNFSGEREGLRFKVTLKVEESFLVGCERVISREFKRYATLLREDEINIEEEAKIRKIQEDLLKDNYCAYS